MTKRINKKKLALGLGLVCLGIVVIGVGVTLGSSVGGAVLVAALV